MPFLKINYKKSKPDFEDFLIFSESYSLYEVCSDVLAFNSIKVIPSLLPDTVLVVDGDAKRFDDWPSRINVAASKLVSSDVFPVVGYALLAHLVDDVIVPLSELECFLIRDYFPLDFFAEEYNDFHYEEYYEECYGDPYFDYVDEFDLDLLM